MHNQEAQPSLQPPSYRFQISKTFDLLKLTISPDTTWKQCKIEFLSIEKNLEITHSHWNCRLTFTACDFVIYMICVFIKSIIFLVVILPWLNCRRDHVFIFYDHVFIFLSSMSSLTFRPHLRLHKCLMLNLTLDINKILLEDKKSQVTKYHLHFGLAKMEKFIFFFILLMK